MKSSKQRVKEINRMFTEEQVLQLLRPQSKSQLRRLQTQLEPLTDEELRVLLLAAWAKSKTAPRTQP